MPSLERSTINEYRSYVKYVSSGLGRYRRQDRELDPGHANDAMMLNIYASADANAKQAAAATIDEVMERRLSPQEMGSFA